jgi:hypothetical protein
MGDDNARWFTNFAGCVGIVKVIDQYDEVKYYISAVQGLDIEEDIEHIQKFGASFPKSAGDVLFN